ncbi:uncharacterized protein NESG_00367 [Nematocida ausubeli]|uniref:C3H1-type domain-containing protein n=1 Tax=Nematocida ausubeli (strain ATCC PRA-371 / ERTm2) TaxID=1913371 RepID=A0A086J571_NEMA1|nr:uncharacterized protein NESG_00367 [Nematocida ausubeli]KAI5133651.1 hypothetical protein NEAUS06_0663 [Nematocida ausubeli]KFG27289.1 hypothetical protein NESG_00367 [Nematocida ausubeli]
MAKKEKGKDQIKPKDAKKLVEDQMFGMKNKGKSAKLKKMASSLEASYLKTKPQAAEKKVEEPVFEAYEILQKVPVGVDPSTILCVNFKANKKCSKGTSCKFSHDLKKKTTAPVAQKEGAKEKDADGVERPVCKYYIDALKSGKHNPKWVCPNGNACLGKHSPPEGYILKEDAADIKTITQDELLEEKRANLPKTQTKMTEEKYKEWKEKREQNKIEQKKEEDKIKEGNLRLGKILPSGKDLFVYNPKIFIDDDEALEYDYNAREEEIESEEEAELAEKLTDTLNITN